MCTLTWVRREAGYELFFNRDERFTRGPALAPRIHERGVCRWVAPVDPDGGGTWIGVNQFGLSVALLNGYRREDLEQRPWQSRGLLVDSVLDSLSTREVRVRLERRDLRAVRSFTLVAIEPAAPALIVTWDGRELCWDRRLEGHPPICSSSLDPSGATQARRAVFAELCARRGTVDAELLEEFHACHLPQRGALSPCMHRADAQTQSAVHVRVGGSEVELHYTPGAPCEGLPAEVTVIDRASRAAVRA